MKRIICVLIGHTWRVTGFCGPKEASVMCTRCGLESKERWR